MLYLLEPTPSLTVLHNRTPGSAEILKHANTDHDCLQVGLRSRRPVVVGHVDRRELKIRKVGTQCVAGAIAFGGVVEEEPLVAGGGFVDRGDGEVDQCGVERVCPAEAGPHVRRPAEAGPYVSVRESLNQQRRPGPH